MSGPRKVSAYVEISWLGAGSVGSFFVYPGTSDDGRVVKVFVIGVDLIFMDDADGRRVPARGQLLHRSLTTAWATAAAEPARRAAG